MICPGCKNEMIVVEYHQIELDHCTNCGGVWFDAGELALFLAASKLKSAEDTVQEIVNSPEAGAPHKRRKCPICHHGMKEVAIGQPPLHLDVCSQGDGLWFDGGEVHELVARMAARMATTGDSQQGIIAFVNEVFQAESKGTA